MGSDTLRWLRDQVLMLPAGERAELAHELVKSLVPPPTRMPRSAGRRSCCAASPKSTRAQRGWWIETSFDDECSGDLTVDSATCPPT